MKKFSVLLIVVLFFVPVFVYGLTGSSLTKPIGLVSSIRKFAPVAKVLSLGHQEVIKPLAVNPMLPDNPFFPAPNGIRGIITEINIAEKMIFVKDAVYFSEVRQIYEKADFRIYTNETTDFYNNLIPGGVFEDLQVGDEIISKGSINFADHTSKYSVAMYKGKFYFPEDKKMVEYFGTIKSIDKNNFTLVLNAPNNTADPTIEISLIINETTKCSVFPKPGVKEDPVFLGLKVIPDFAKVGTFVRGTMFVTPTSSEFVADIVSFTKE